jgi:putative ABC transport system substrate-binding protein
LGFVEGQNIAVEYRWAEFHFERLPTMAADLAGRQVAVIAAISGTPTVLAAKAATTTIPIVFAIGSDPIASGVVTSLNRPSGNVTGVSIFGAELGAKRVELLHELVPNAMTIALLVDEGNPVSAGDAANMLAAARKLGQQTLVVNVTAEDQIEDAFRIVGERQIGALLVTGDAFFVGQRDRLIALRRAMRFPRCIPIADLPKPEG